MQFGSREICDVVLRAKYKTVLGDKTFYKDEPILYFTTLKTSSMEGAATTVYATGGQGNPNLVAWDGDRTLTFNMEDALISPESLAVLTGAGLIDASETKPIMVHTTSQVEALDNDIIGILDNYAAWNGGRVEQVMDINDSHYNANADIYVMRLDDHGQIEVEPCVPAAVEYDKEINGVTYKTVITCHGVGKVDSTGAYQQPETAIKRGDIVLVDYYVQRMGGAKQIEITADKFGGTYYLEGSTLFRDADTGMDMPAEIIIPKCKVQSNFTISMAATGDPSTYSFVLDAMPDYTKFDRTKKVLAAIQIISDETGDMEADRPACTDVNSGLESSSNEVSISRSGNTFIVSGEDITSEYDTTMYPNYNGKAITVTIPLDSEANETYKLVTVNPAYKHWASDPKIEYDAATDTYTKTNEVLSDGDLQLMVILTDEDTADVKIKMYKDDKLVRTYTVKNQLTFA